MLNFGKECLTIMITKSLGLKDCKVYTDEDAPYILIPLYTGIFFTKPLNIVKQDDQDSKHSQFLEHACIYTDRLYCIVMTLLCNRYSNTEILARHKQYFLFNNNISEIGDRPCCLTSQVCFYLIVIISAIIYI